MRYTGITMFLVLWASWAIALQTANSLPLSGSYLLRAHGTEALYWNPANINQDYQDIIIPGFNLALGLTNSAFDLDTYNYINGRYLNDADKALLLDKIDHSLRLNNDMHLLLLGMTFGNLAISTSTNEYSKVRLSKDYLRIVLYGNEDADYVFSKPANQGSALVYQDITLGIGGWDISEYFKSLPLPQIIAGFSFSTLIGAGIAETEEFTGSLHSGFDGMQFKQDIYLKTGLGGWGAKALFSIQSVPMPKLKVGASLDNIGGFIKWAGKNDRYHYQVESDSVFAADMDEDFVTSLDSTWAIGNFTTKLPMEMHLGALYKYRNANLSIEYVQGFTSSELTSSIGNFSFGVEYAPITVLPFQAGIRFGNNDVPWSTSYGFGLREKNISWGFGIQSYKSVLPGNHSTGLSLSSNLTIHY